jgi:hypothetical protein
MGGGPAVGLGAVSSQLSAVSFRMREREYMRTRPSRERAEEWGTWRFLRTEEGG